MSVLEARLFDADGQTPIGPIVRRQGLRWSEEFNGAGFGQITVPTTGMLDLAYDRVIKVYLDGSVVGAFLIEVRDRAHVDPSGVRWVTLSGRGLMGWLDDAIVWPQGGITYNYSPTDRPFNYAGVSGHWYELLTWTRPLGFKQSATSSGDYRYKSPKNWPDPGAYWIWATNPAATVAPGAKSWFRSTFSLNAARKMRFYATADNFFELYLDGALILATSDVKAEGATYTGFAERVIQVPSGPHILAAYVTNGNSGSPGDRAGFLMSATLLNADGSPSTVLRHSDLTTWYVTDTEPLWYPAEMLDVIIAEHRGRALDAGQSSRLENLRIGWTSVDDSNGNPWTTAKALSFRCGTTALDVVNNLVDHSIDFWVDPGTITLHAAETRGSNKATAVRLAKVKNLTGYDTSSTKTRSTAALVRSAGGWTAATDTAGVAAYGRRETFLEFGNTRSEATAASAATRILKRTARVATDTPRVQFTITADARPFLDFAPGDVITVPASNGGTTTGRVLSLAIVEDDFTGTTLGEATLEVAA